MILGIGVDIVEIDRFKRSIERYGDRFLERLFSDDEIAYCRAHKYSAQHFAVRFAAKEAVLKALRHGIGPGVSMKEIRITRGERGEPSVELEGRTKALADRKGVQQLHVSLSHSQTTCIAQVVAEG